MDPSASKYIWKQFIQYDCYSDRIISILIYKQIERGRGRKREKRYYKHSWCSGCCIISKCILSLIQCTFHFRLFYCGGCCHHHPELFHNETYFTCHLSNQSSIFIYNLIVFQFSTYLFHPHTSSSSTFSSCSPKQNVKFTSNFLCSSLFDDTIKNFKQHVIKTFSNSRKISNRKIEMV